MMNVVSSTLVATTLDQWLVDWFCGLFPSGEGYQALANFILVIISLLLSIGCCSIIGIEREKRGRSAGLRTHLLVGFGSTIIMVISIYGFSSIWTTRDPARLAAQVIAGVGFLGAGAIIHNKSGSGIKGLTTASTIWLVMAIGLACGSFNFLLAILATAIVLIVLTVFRKVEKAVNRSNPLLILLCKSNVPVLALLNKTADDFGVTISDIATQLISDDDIGLIEVTFMVSSDDSFDVKEFADTVRQNCHAVTLNVVNKH